MLFRVDKKTVNVISTGIFNDDLKVMTMTLNFFLSRDGRLDEEDKEKEEKESGVGTRDLQSLTIVEKVKEGSNAQVRFYAHQKDQEEVEIVEEGLG